MMNGKAGALASLVVVTGLTLGALMFLAGCAKGKPATTQQAQAVATQASASEQGAKAVLEQKTCPVMEGNPIDKNIFVEYQGNKVYLCCAACKAKFLANPEQHVSKLPQFAK
jgi:YHS domain-containing protein